MTAWETVEEILDFAIENEDEAVRFYTELAETSQRSWMRETFLGFAKEEAGHKAKLIGIKKSGKLGVSDKAIQNLEIADYMVEVTATPNMDYQQALVVAMHKEKAAFRLYSDLAEQADEPEIKAAFLALAQEEAKHKLRFEVEYDDLLTEN